MKTIYLCGGINGLTNEQCTSWREKVKDKLKDKYEFLDPMRRDYRGREDECVDEIVEGDYQDIANSDIILANACKPSWGTAMEIHQSFTQGRGVIVVCDSERVSPWLRAHSDCLFTTLEQAISSLEEGDPC